MKKTLLNWINILHFYQPPFQAVEITQKITDECYLPVSRLLLEIPDAKAVVNINGCLLEILYHHIQGGKEVIDNLTALLSLKQIEVTGTGKYHPILPLIPDSEAERQISLQEDSLKQYINIQQRPKILFLPECAFMPEQMRLLKKWYPWVIVDEASIKGGKKVIGKYQLKAKKSGINILARDRDLSESLCNFAWRKYDIQSSEDFVKHSLERTDGEGFVVTVSDAEVFGHHQKNRWKLLKQIYTNPLIDSKLARDISGQYKIKEVDTIAASWSTSEEEIAQKIYYPLWYNPQNRIHQLLWQLFDLTLNEIRGHGSESENKTMDTLFSSCPFFWASCKPWWNGIIVENASDRMFNLIKKTKWSSEKTINFALIIREKIYDEVSILNRTGRAKELQDELFENRIIKIRT